jgi:hypothetical protein
MRTGSARCLNARRNRLGKLQAQAGDGQEDEDQSLDKDGSHRSLPGDAARPMYTNPSEEDQ